MKSKNSLKNFDFLKWFKPALIVSLVLVVIAGILWGVVGFNKGFDFTGGTQLVVEFDTTPYNLERDEDLSVVTDKIKDVLDQNNVDINSMQILGEYNTQSLVITFKNTDEKTVRNIRLEINKHLNTSSAFVNLPADQRYKILDDESVNAFDITKKTTTAQSLISPTAVITTVSTLLFALVIAMIYGLIRFKTAGGLTLVFAGVFNVVLTLAFALITRIQINTYFFGLLSIILLVSVYMASDLLFNLKEKSKEPALTEKTNYDLANIVTEQNFAKTIVVGSISLGVALICGLFGTINVLQLALLSIVGIAVCVASHLFVVPAFWAFANKKRELLKPQVVVNNKDNDAEVVEVEENNEEDDAEVVEVKDDNK